MSVSLLTGGISGELTLDGRSETGATVHVGPFVWTGIIDQETAGFNGLVYNHESGLGPLSLAGGFFGPQGQEMAYTFNYYHRDNTTNFDLVFYGSVAGRR
jgi:hypothetical protein